MKVLVLLLSCCFVVLASACDYQRIDPGHTMCVHPARSCVGKTLLRSGGVTCQDRQVILETHNRLRQMLALGQIRGQPACLDMRELVWDEELATVAQRWADQCTAGHDRHRRVDRFSVGQNVAVAWTFDKPSLNGDEPEFKRQIEAWFNEVTQVGFRPQDIEPFTFNRQAGHYSQIAWSETYVIGCGYSYFRDPQRGYTKLYVCNYGPGGNIIGAKMYKSGRPGQTMCINEGLATSRRYPGLCELLSGVDYRDQLCYAAVAPAVAPAAIDHQAQLTGVAAAAGPQQPAPLAAAAPAMPVQTQPPLIASPIHSPAPSAPPTPSSPPTAPVTDLLLRGIQSPFAGLAKLFNQYNLFG